jgi:hypothetical protein
LTRIRDPGWKKFGSGINIPDPKLWVKNTVGDAGLGSGSGSFYHHAKIIRKTLNPTIL